MIKTSYWQTRQTYTPAIQASAFESVGLEIAPVHLRSLQTGQNRARVELFKGRTTGAVRGAVC